MMHVCLFAHHLDFACRGGIDLCLSQAASSRLPREHCRLRVGLGGGFGLEWGLAGGGVWVSSASREWRGWRSCPVHWPVQARRGLCGNTKRVKTSPTSWNTKRADPPTTHAHPQLGARTLLRAPGITTRSNVLFCLSQVLAGFWGCHECDPR